MALRKIRLEGDEILRKKSKPVKRITEKEIQLLDDMRETLEAADWVGLAAPQVGILKRIVLVDVRDEDGLLELINPEIIETRGEQCRQEGCLSLPGEVGYVLRPEYIKVKYMDRLGNEQIVEGEDLKAIALNHEIDHLDGILYIDKIVEVEETEEEFDEYDEYQEVESNEELEHKVTN